MVLDARTETTDALLDAMRWVSVTGEDGGRTEEDPQVPPTLVLRLVGGGD